MKLSRTIHFNPLLFTIVPFLNVTFLLLIFFFLTSSFVLQSGILVNLPLSSFTMAPPRDSKILTITADPTITIFYKDQKLSLQELDGALTKEPGKTLIIKADGAVPYDMTMKVASKALEKEYSVVLATRPQEQ